MENRRAHHGHDAVRKLRDKINRQIFKEDGLASQGPTFAESSDTSPSMSGTPPWVSRAQPQPPASVGSESTMSSESSEDGWVRSYTRNGQRAKP